MVSEVNLRNLELKHILKEVQCLSGFDFSKYAYSFILRRTEQFMQINSIHSEADFIYKINKFTNVAGQFLDFVFAQQFELFRDAEVWNYLTNKILPKYTNRGKLTIHFPYIADGNELFSLLFILNNFSSEKIKIIVTGVTDNHISILKKECFTEKHIKNSTKNIELLSPPTDIEGVFNRNKDCISVINNFKGEIIYETCDFFNYKYLTEIDIVIFRNRMLNFNKELQEKVIKTIINSIKKGGYLLIGANEKIDCEIGKKLKKVDKNLSVFKKKIFF